MRQIVSQAFPARSCFGGGGWGHAAIGRGMRSNARYARPSRSQAVGRAWYEKQPVRKRRGRPDAHRRDRSCSRSWCRAVGSIWGRASPRPASTPCRAENPEEVIVRGRRIGAAFGSRSRRHASAPDVFNEINTIDELDVSCRAAKPGWHACTAAGLPRAVSQHDVSADAAREYMAALASAVSNGVADRKTVCSAITRRAP